MAFDPLKLSSGLVEGDIKVTEAAFLFDPEYQNGQALRLELTVQHEDGEQVIKLGCGKGWTSRDKGLTCEHETKPDANFNKNSGVGMFFGGTKGVSESLPGLVGLLSDDASIEKAVLAKVKEVELGPRDRQFWLGLECHVSRIDVDFGGEIGVMDRVVIDGFTGWENSTKAAGAKKAAGAAKKAAGAAKKSDDGGLTDEIRAQLDAIADDADNHDGFAEAAFAAIPEASSDEVIKAAILDTSPEGIWEQAVDRFNAANPE